MIILTEEAVKKLKAFSEDESIGHLCIRVKCIGGGCSGIVRDMIFDDYTTDMDEIFEQDDIKIIVDCVSYSYLGPTTIDYISSTFGGGFKFIGAEELKTCGCGSSFTIGE